jgi:hypothetical protein
MQPPEDQTVSLFHLRVFHHPRHSGVNPATFKKMLDKVLASLDTAVSLGCSDGVDFAIGGKLC